MQRVSSAYSFSSLASRTVRTGVFDCLRGLMLMSFAPVVGHPWPVGLGNYNKFAVCIVISLSSAKTNRNYNKVGFCRQRGKYSKD
jgi:hypothetical protein